MSAARELRRGINPRRRWQYERDDAFDRAVLRSAETLGIAAACYVAALILAVVVGGGP